MDVATLLRKAEKGILPLAPPSVVVKHRYLHLAVMSFLMVGHTLVHYAYLIPALGETVGRLPFFNLHVLHEAEYLVVIAYASLVFRLRGGVAALAATVAASLPFLFASRITPLAYGGAGSEYGEYGAQSVEPGLTGGGNAIIEVTALLIIGCFIVFVNEMWGRERDRRIQAMQQIESTNRQLSALNQSIQGRLNTLFGTLAEAVEEETAASSDLPPGPARDRLAGILHKVAQAIGR